MKKSNPRTFSTREACEQIGVTRITLVRWIAQKKIVPSISLPMGAGRNLWRWTAADVRRARKIDQTPGRKPKKGRVK
jgi:hypothetical protein